MIVIGLDPGVAGAFAVLTDSDVLLLDDLPVHQVGVAGRKTLRSELDLHSLHALLAEHAPFRHAFIEKVGTRPGQGVTGVFRFGVVFGALTGLLVALGVPLSFVQPKDWQRYHGIGPAPDAARQRAAQLFPAMAPHLAKKRDEHRADALLIAAYGLHRLAATTTQSQS